MSSLSLLLKQAGYTVSPMKADMYLNIDAGTMNPLEHGASYFVSYYCAASRTENEQT